MANKKFIGLLTLALTLSGLVACGGGSKTDSSHKHKFVDVGEPTKQATCTEKGEKIQKCEICGEQKPVEIKALGHDYKDVEGSEVPATCTEKGSKQQKCSRCQDTKTVEIQELGHNFENVEGGTAATCTEAGTQNQKCSRCDATNEETIQPLGHDFQNVEGGTAATCSQAGSQLQKCSRCDATNSVEIPALGHNYQPVGEEVTPKEGYAAVRVYQCQNGCNGSSLGFKASEPSAESKSHLVIDETTGGAKFWGRPIGNNLELDESGKSVNEQVGELVFDETQTGDFFEYKFELTKAQADALKDAYLYCDAKPEDYMAQNNVDFWAYGADSSDWTPGAYIDGDRKGEIIDDYRYVLYVDGILQAFDSTMPKSPCHADGNGGGGQWGGSAACKREEFILPYKFNLHEGTNTIKLVMAGGYRSTFYNFTFRALEQENPEPGPTPHEHAYTRGEKLESDLYPITCTCGEIEGYEIQHNGEKMNSKKKVAFNVAGIKAGQYEVYVSAMISRGNESTTNGFSYGEQLSTEGASGGDPVPGRYYVQADAGDLVYTNTGDKSYPDVNINSSTEFHWTNCSIATINIKNGTASFTFGHAGPGYSIQLDAIRLIRVGDVQMTVLKEFTFADISAGNTGGSNLSDTFIKLGANGNYITLNYNAAEAKNVTLQVLLTTKATNASKAGIYNQDGGKKFELKVNDAEVTLPADDARTLADIGVDSKSNSGVSDGGSAVAVAVWFDFANISLQQGDNTIVFKYVGSGYSLDIGGFKLAY